MKGRRRATRLHAPPVPRGKPPGLTNAPFASDVPQSCDTSSNLFSPNGGIPAGTGFAHPRNRLGSRASLRDRNHETPGRDLRARYDIPIRSAVTVVTLERDLTNRPVLAIRMPPGTGRIVPMDAASEIVAAQRPAVTETSAEIAGYVLRHFQVRKKRWNMTFSGGFARLESWQSSASRVSPRDLS